MKPSKTVLLSVAAVVFLANLQSKAQKLCSSPSSLPGRSDVILIQNVSETTPPNTVLRRLDIVGSELEITLHSMNVSDNIGFNESSRDLIVKKSFNVTVGSPENVYIDIACTAPGINVVLKIVIQVYDMNNNPPRFVNLPYSVNISERTAANSIVFSGVQAVDADPSDKGYLIYSVDDRNNLSSFFSFPLSTVGSLVLTKTIDYDSLPRLNLTITVMDNGNNLTILGQLQPQYTATTTILINVLPADDYNPVFNQSTYTGTFTIDTQLSRMSAVLLPSVGATIKNAKPDEQFFYSVVQDDNNVDAMCFSIDNRTGVISATSLSQQMLLSIAAFQIQATKVGQSYRYGRALVKLKVTRNAGRLEFSQRIYYATITDGAPNGTLTATVVMVEGNPAPEYYFNEGVRDFTINSKTGEIRTTTIINYKDSTLYNFTVAANVSNSINFCRVIVTVIRLNSHNPHFDKSIYYFNISEDTSFVAQIKPTDEDKDAVLSYQLIDSSSCFEVNDNATLLRRCTSTALSSNSALGGGNTHSMLLIVKDDGEPARQDSALVVVSWNASGLLPVGVQSCGSGAEVERLNVYYIAVIALGSATGLFLLISFILAICLCRRCRTTPDPRPRVTIEVARTTQKSHNSGSPSSSKSSGNGFEVAKEYSPYFAYGSGDVITHPPQSTLNSGAGRTLKSKVPLDDDGQAPRFENLPTPNCDDRGQDTGTASHPSRQQQRHRSQPRSSSSVKGRSSSSSSSPRYRFEETVGPPRVPAECHRSASQSVRAASSVPGHPMRFNSVPGPRRGSSRLPAAVLAALTDSNSGDTSSTETLMTTVTSRAARPSNVSFTENSNGGYLSSQEGLDVSMSALTRRDEDPAITVYY